MLQKSAPLEFAMCFCFCYFTCLILSKTFCPLYNCHTLLPHIFFHLFSQWNSSTFSQCSLLTSVQWRLYINPLHSFLPLFVPLLDWYIFPVFFFWVGGCLVIFLNFIEILNNLWPQTDLLVLNSTKTSLSQQMSFSQIHCC